jgi:hypothetical protein
MKARKRMNKQSVDDILQSRSNTHGDYAKKCVTIQAIKNAMRNSDHSWHLLRHDIQESLDMFATKIGRIIHGDEECIDHWQDIEGYARLISQRLQGERE